MVDPQLETTYEELSLRTKEVMRLQLAHLEAEAKKGSLSASDSTSLVSLAKFLAEMAREESEAAAALSEEELRRIAARMRKRKSRNIHKNDALNESQPEDRPESSEPKEG